MTANVLGENEDQNHADEDPRLLSDTTNTGVTNDSDGETRRETGETNGETGTELDEAGVEGHGGLELSRDEDRNDETVNLTQHNSCQYDDGRREGEGGGEETHGNDTGHDDGNDTLHHQVGTEDTHRGDSDARLGGTVGRADASEDDGGGAAPGDRRVEASSEGEEGRERNEEGSVVRLCLAGERGRVCSHDTEEGRVDLYKASHSNGSGDGREREQAGVSGCLVLSSSFEGEWERRGRDVRGNPRRMHYSSVHPAEQTGERGGKEERCVSSTATRTAAVPMGRAGW